jgi:hypothetical protein
METVATSPVFVITTPGDPSDYRGKTRICLQLMYTYAKGALTRTPSKALPQLKTSSREPMSDERQVTQARQRQAKLIQRRRKGEVSILELAARAHAHPGEGFASSSPPIEDTSIQWPESLT